MLQNDNQRLQRELQEARHAGTFVGRQLQAIRYRSMQHRRSREHLVSAVYWVRSAEFITFILGMILAAYIGIPHIVRFFIKKKDVRTWYKSMVVHNLLWHMYHEVISFILAIIGFAIAIPAQRTFPIPWRSFVTALLSVVKQMIDIS